MPKPWFHSLRPQRSTVTPATVTGHVDRESVGDRQPSTVESLVDIVMSPPCFFDVFQHHGIPLLFIVIISILWTICLIGMNYAPNTTANLIAGTEHYDDGHFWLIVESQYRDLSVVTLTFILLCYVSVLHDIFSFKSKFRSDRDVSEYHTDLEYEEFFKVGYKMKFMMLYQLYDSVVGYESKYRRRWNSIQKVNDLLIQSITLYQVMQAGSLQLTYACGSIIALNSFGYAILLLFGRKLSGFSEVVIDSIFDMLIAVGFPMSSLIYSRMNLELEHDLFGLRIQVFPAGSFERVARLTTDPTDMARYLFSIDSLRIKSILSFIVMLGVNLSLCYRLKRLVAIRIKRTQLKRKRQVTKLPQRTNQSKVPRLCAAIFLIISVLAIAIPYKSIKNSEDRCNVHPECVVVAYEWNKMDNCPCLAYIDVDKAPKTYEEWIHPPDATQKLRSLSISGYLRSIFIANRELPELPVELANCKDLRQLSLIYTGIKRLPEWGSVFTELENLHIQDKLGTPTFVEIADEFLEGKYSLTNLNLGSVPYLKRLPPLKDLAQLRTFVIGYAFEMADLPPFDQLVELQKLSIIYGAKFTSLPDLARVGTLDELSITAYSPICCNGFISSCDLLHPYCQSDELSNTPAATCVDDSKSVSNGTVKLLRKHENEICKWLSPSYIQSLRPPTRDSVDACGGVMYRECSIHDVVDNNTVTHQGICFNSRMRVISCTTDPYIIEYRQKSIELGIGAKCDPVIEGWLGCTK